MKIFISLLLFLNCAIAVSGQNARHKNDTVSQLNKEKKIFYGEASFYDDKFNGKKTASGQIFSQKKYSAACNILPLGTYIRVTNLKNNKSVLVRTNDRLHPKINRIVDLSKIAAEQLNFLKSGITKVKVEIIKPPHKKR